MMESVSFVARWLPFSCFPSEDGRYVVCHRGRMFGNAYFQNGVWIQWPKWSPTHWLDGGYDRLESIPIGFPRMEEQLGYTPKTFY